MSEPAARITRLFRPGLICSLILCVSAATAANEEPSYNGRVLSEWLGDMVLGRASDGRPGPFSAMGTNAIPTLLKWMSYEPSSAELARETEENVVHGRPVTNLSRYPAQRAERAVYAFHDLGPAARPAIPELTRLAQTASGPKQADLFTRALAFIGPDAVPALVSLASNSSSWTRYEAVSWLGRFTDDPTVAAPLVPMLVNFMCDASINATNDYAFEGPAQATLLVMAPQVVVPALTNALQSSSVHARRRAIETLLAFEVQSSTNVPPGAVPALRAAMRDTDSQVRSVATEVLRLMDVSESPRANPQGSADGRQPSGSKTNRTPEAAESHRSP